MSRFARACVVVAWIAAIAGCSQEAPYPGFDVPGAGDPVTDTGFVGSWSRGNEQNRSVVMIFHDGERYRFRWQARSADGHWRVDCDWAGRCEEFDYQMKVADHTLRVLEGTPEDMLVVEKVSVKVSDPSRQVRFVDEWEVADGGLALFFRALQRGDREYVEGDEGRPRGRLDKISDQVADPPAA